MSLDLIGTYRDHPILLQEVIGLDDLAVDDVSHAVVLLWLGGNSWGRGQLERAVKRFASKSVLSLTVAGELADEAFSIVLETLGSLPTRKHIMTGIIRDTEVRDLEEDALIVKDAVEEFLTGTWPDEARFDEWTQYRIIVTGQPELSRCIRQSSWPLT